MSGIRKDVLPYVAISDPQPGQKYIPRSWGISRASHPATDSGSYQSAFHRADVMDMNGGQDAMLVNEVRSLWQWARLTRVFVMVWMNPVSR